MEISNEIIGQHIYALIMSDYFDDDTEDVGDAADQLMAKGGSLVIMEEVAE